MNTSGRRTRSDSRSRPEALFAEAPVHVRGDRMGRRNAAALRGLADRRVRLDARVVARLVGPLEDVRDRTGATLGEDDLQVVALEDAAQQPVDAGEHRVD